MKIILLLVLLSFISPAFSQQIGDSKVIVKISDTSALYIQVKRALVKNGFTVKDDMNTIVLTTNSSIKKHLGYTIIIAEIKNDTVVFKGFYCNKKFDLKGDIIEPNRFKNIIYFKGSNGWPLLYSIANEINSKSLSFEK